MGKEYDSDLFVAKAAVQRGHLTQPQVLACLKELGNSALYKNLGEMLVAKGHLTGDQLDALHAELSKAPPRPPSSGDVPSLNAGEVLFGQLLIKKGYATPDQIKEALRAQAAARASNPNQSIRLGDILIQKGQINLTQIEEVLDLSKKIVKLRCDACGAVYQMMSYDSSKKYHCKKVGDEGKCGGTLQPTSPVTTPRHGTSTVSHSIAHVPVPEDVRQAAGDAKKILGKYVLIKEIGRGGMGVVYRAWDSALNREVAVKLLLGSDQGEEEIQRFYREAQTAATLSHPNIAGVYDVGELDGKYFIALQFIDGKNLAGMKLPLSRALEIMRKVALAVDYAHHQGIIHRDLKPQNIMLDPHSEPFVMDFGLAKSMKGSSITQTGSIMGTPAYMSPEQAEGNAKLIGKKSDVYSLGATLYELLTGRPPFRGDNSFDVMMRVVNEDPVPPSKVVRNLPPDVEVICLKAMEKDPILRYGSAKALADDLGRHLAGDTIMAKPAGLAVSISKRVKKNRAVLIPIAVAAVVLLVGILVFAGMAIKHSRDVDRLTASGEAAFAKQDYESALRDFEQAHQLGGSTPKLKDRIEECRREIQRQKEIAASERTQAAHQVEEAKRAAEARQKKLDDARPDFNKGRQILEEAQKDLYRPGADLNAMRDRLGEAIDRFDAAIAICGFHADAYYHRGLARKIRFETDAAEKDFTLAIKHEPKHTQATIARGRLYAERYQDVLEIEGWRIRYTKENPGVEWREKALADFKAAAAAGESDSMEFLQGLIAFSEWRNDDAAAIAARVIVKQPTNEEGFRLRAEAVYWGIWRTRHTMKDAEVAEKLEPVLNDCNEAIKLRVNYFEVLKLRGVLHYEHGEPEKALTDFEAAFAMNPADCRVNEALGTYHAHEAQSQGARGDAEGARREFDAALGFYNRSIAVRPTYRNLQARSVTRLQMGDPQGALNDLDKSIELNPYFASSRYHRAVALTNMGHPDQALREMDEAVKLEPTRWNLWSARAGILEKLGRPAEAIKDLEQALKCDPSEPGRSQVEAALKRLKGQEF